MFILKKILPVFFIILVFIVIFGVCFVFYKKIIVLNFNLIKKAFQIVTKPQTSNLDQFSKTQKEIIERNFANLGAKVTTASSITNVYTGIVIETTYKPNATPSYLFSMRLNSLRDQGIIGTFILNKNDLTKVKFFKVENGKETLIFPEDLNINDLVTYEKTIDLNKDFENNIISGIIKKHLGNR